MTTDGRIVVKGVFYLVGSQGVPLSMLLPKMQEDDIVVDWLDYVTHAIKDGAKPKNLKPKIMEAYRDACMSNPKEFEVKLTQLMEMINEH